jgi:uncharacterized membrane protein
LSAVVAVYGVCWGWWLLFPNALFWDDWAFFFDKTPDQHRALWAGEGKHFLNPMLNPVLLELGFWPFRLLTFVSYLVAGVAMNGILRRQPVLTALEKRVVLFIFLLAPINGARYSLQTTEYAYSYAAFFVGWLLITDKRVMSQITAALLFVLSFGTPSLMVFFLIPFTERVLRSGRGPKTIRQIAQSVLRNVHWALLPPLLWAQFQVGTNSSGKYSLTIGVFVLMMVVVAFCTGCGWIYLRRDSSSALGLLMEGIGVIALAITPYVTTYPSLLADPLGWFAGFLPNSSDWGSRHGLLWPLGFALTIVGVLRRVGDEKVRSTLAVTVISVLATTTTYMGMLYAVDWSKQQGMIAALQSSPLRDQIGSAQRFVVHDATTRFNARNRAYRGYEWSGIFQSAFGSHRPDIEATRFGSLTVACGDLPTQLIVVNSPDTILAAVRRLRVEIQIDVFRLSADTC